MLLGISAFYVVVGFIGAPRQLYQVLMVVLLGVTVFLGVVLVGSSWGSKFAALQQLSTRLPSLFRGLPGADAGFHPAEVGGTLTWLVFLPVPLALGRWLRAESAEPGRG